MTSTKPILVIFNPVASFSRKRVLAKLIKFLKQHQLEWQLYPTERSLSANKHYLESHYNEFSQAVVVGGDGTFHNIVNCLVGKNIDVTLVPAGTGNDFAQWLYGKRKKDLNFVFSSIVSDNTVAINLGCCEFPDGQQRYFHNVMGLGFDASLAKELTHSKGLFRHLGYLVKALQNIPFYKEPYLELRGEGKQWQYQNLITAFANGQYFGAGMHIAPSADPLNNSLEICRVEKVSLLKKLHLIGKLFNGRHIDSPLVDYRTVNGDFEVTTANLGIEADGEYIGESPVVIGVKEDALRLKKPN